MLLDHTSLAICFLQLPASRTQTNEAMPGRIEPPWWVLLGTRKHLHIINTQRIPQTLTIQHLPVQRLAYPSELPLPMLLFSVNLTSGSKTCIVMLAIWCHIHQAIAVGPASRSSHILQHGWVTYAHTLHLVSNTLKPLCT